MADAPEPRAVAMTALELLLDLAAGGVVLWLVLRWTTGGLLPPVLALTQVSHVVLGVAALLALPALLLRRRRAGAVLGLCLLPLGWETLRGGIGLDPADARKGGTPFFTVLTFNVGDGVTRAEDFLPTLRACDADVIALQEVGGYHVAALRRELADEYPYMRLHGLGIPGMGILSRFPILEEELFHGPANRPHQRALLDVRGRRVGVLNVHLRLSIAVLGRWSPAAGDLEELVARATDGEPWIVLGDFNTTARSDEYALLRDAGLEDSWRELGGGLGFTFPVAGRYRRLPLPPLVRIDYLWHTPHLRALWARVLEDGGSDHLPLQVWLAFEEDSPDGR